MAEEKPQIIITFNGDGSALFTLQFTGTIYPAQLLGLAQTLEFEAKYMMSTSKNQQEYVKAQEELNKAQIITPNQSKISIPKLKFDE